MVSTGSNGYFFCCRQSDDPNKTKSNATQTWFVHMPQWNSNNKTVAYLDTEYTQREGSQLLPWLQGHGVDTLKFEMLIANLYTKDQPGLAPNMPAGLEIEDMRKPEQGFHDPDLPRPLVRVKGHVYLPPAPAGQEAVPEELYVMLYKKNTCIQMEFSRASGEVALWVFEEHARRAVRTLLYSTSNGHQALYFLPDAGGCSGGETLPMCIADRAGNDDMTLDRAREGPAWYSESLMVRRWREGVVLSYLPRQSLRGMLPDTLVENYHFWQHEGGRIIEGEPMDQGSAWHGKRLRITVHGTGGAVVQRGSMGSKSKAGFQPSETLLRAERAPPGRLRTLTEILARSEPLSHVLLWTKATAPAHGEAVHLSDIELPRLGLRFAVSRETVQEEGRLELVTRVMALDFGGLFISDHFPEHLVGCAPHALVLQDQCGNLTAVVPNCLPKSAVCPMTPFGTSIVLCRPAFVNEKKRVYAYPVHISNTFLQTSHIASALYLALLQLMHREYGACAALLKSCVPDVPFDYEEQKAAAASSLAHPALCLSPLQPCSSRLFYPLSPLSR